MDISDEEQLEEVIEEKVEERVEERMKEERQKIKREVRKQVNNSNNFSKSGDNEMTRRKFLKMLGVGAGGLALSSSVAGLTWSKITPLSQGASNINAEIASGLTSTTLGTGIAGGDGTDLSLDESVIKDGGVKEIDAQEFAGGAGTSGQVLMTDGAAASWKSIPSDSLSIESPQDVMASRSAGTQYTNSTGVPLKIYVIVGSSSIDGTNSDFLIDGKNVSTVRDDDSTEYETLTHSVLVPDKSTYKVTVSGGAIDYWFEQEMSLV